MQKRLRLGRSRLPLLPKGTILKATSWFDNTAKNANIIEPRNQANWGRRSVVNMFMVFEQVALLTEEQYQEELAKRRQHLTETQTWNEVIGCPGCFERGPGGGPTERASSQPPATPSATAAAR